MEINSVIIIASSIIFIISIIVLVGVLKKIEQDSNANNDSEQTLIVLLSKLNKIESEIQDTFKIQENTRQENTRLKYTIEDDNLSEIERMISKGYSVQEIAKKMDKSVRAIELMIRLKKGDKN